MLFSCPLVYKLKKSSYKQVCMLTARSEQWVLVVFPVLQGKNISYYRSWNALKTPTLRARAARARNTLFTDFIQQFRYTCFYGTCGTSPCVCILVQNSRNTKGAVSVFGILSPFVGVFNSYRVYYLLVLYSSLSLLHDIVRVKSQIISVVCQIQRFDFLCNLVVTQKLIRILIPIPPGLDSNLLQAVYTHNTLLQL